MDGTINELIVFNRALDKTEIRQIIFNVNEKYKDTKSMSNIKRFFKDLTISEVDKELKKAGLKDEQLSWTDSAKDIVLDLVAKSKGKKDWHELCVSVCKSEVSTLELDRLFSDYYQELLTNAIKFNKENKK